MLGFKIVRIFMNSAELKKIQIFMRLSSRKDLKCVVVICRGLSVTIDSHVQYCRIRGVSKNP